MGLKCVLIGQASSLLAGTSIELPSFPLLTSLHLLEIPTPTHFNDEAYGLWERMMLQPHYTKVFLPRKRVGPRA